MEWFTVLSNIVVTLIIYLAYPFSRVYMYGKVSNKKGTRIALLNTAICSTVYLLIGTIATEYNYLIISIIPTILYYFIAKWILVDKKITDKDCEYEKYSSDAIIGFVLSLISIFISGLIYGTVALIFSSFGLKATKESATTQGRGLSIAGLTISIIGIVCMLVYLLLLII